MNVYVDIGLLLGLWAIAATTQRYMICAGMVFLLMAIDVWLNSLNNSLQLCAGILLLFWMVMKDTLKFKEESVVLKYNPLHDKSKLNRHVRALLLIVFGTAFAIRLISFLIFNR